MNRKIIVISIIIGLLVLGFLLWKPKPFKAPQLPKPSKLSLRKADFSQLPGWNTADVRKSLHAFQMSCKTFLKQNPNKSVGSDFVDLQVKDWHPACKEAMTIQTTSNEKIHAFFQNWFTPVEFFENKPVQGLFTGYYMPFLHGSLNKTDKYNVPIYNIPKNLVTVRLAQFDPKLKHRRLAGRVVGHRVVPYYTRAQIDSGALSGLASVVAWINSPIDRSFLEIQGSGIIELTDGTQLPINYVGENGAPYTAIAKVLIDRGTMTRDNASMKHIRRYLESHPQLINRILHKNKSFVFFDVARHGSALGAQGVGLTPGYSLAIDRKWVPLGVPVWLNTTSPDDKTRQQKVFQRLMIAQDTGGAIRGTVRGDVYWGAGERATKLAARMKNPGHYWLLLPRHTLERLQNKIV